MKNNNIFAALAALVAAATALFPVSSVDAAYHFSDFQGKPPVHVYGSTTSKPTGLTPAEIKKIYGLPSTGGNGTIAIIDAYDDATIEADLGVFDTAYKLPAC